MPLEDVLQTELQLPHGAGRSDLTECSGTPRVGTRDVPVGMVEGIKSFKAEL